MFKGCSINIDDDDDERICCLLESSRKLSSLEKWVLRLVSRIRIPVRSQQCLWDVFEFYRAYPIFQS